MKVKRGEVGAERRRVEGTKGKGGRKRKWGNKRDVRRDGR